MKDIRKIKLKKGNIIPLKYDFMFTQIFNNERNIDIIESFLSAYFCIDLEKIKGKVKLKNRNLNIRNKKEKSKQVDLILKLDNQIINIELNNEFPEGKKDRNVIYASNIHSRNLKYSDKTYNNITKTHQINLISVSCNKEKIIEEYFLRNERGEKLTENLQIDVVDMEKAKEKCYTHSKQEENISKWCEAILTDKKDIFKKKVGEMNMSDKTKEKLVKIVEELSEDEECIGLYTELSDRELTYNTMIEDAEIKGREEGAKENTIMIAKEMLKKNMDIDLICELTKLTKDEIDKL